MRSEVTLSWKPYCYLVYMRYVSSKARGEYYRKQRRDLVLQNVRCLSFLHTFGEVSHGRARGEVEATREGWLCLL